MIQLQFLNKVLSTGDASLITLNDLNKDFFSDYYGEFEFIKNHINQYGKVPDKTTFLSRFPNFDIFEVKETDKYLLDTLYEDRNKRQLAKTFNRVREALNANDIDKAMRVFSKAQEDITSVKHLEAVNIFEDISRYDSYIERTKDISKFYIHTGFPELDEIMGGWDRKEELAVIMARTNQGKSWLLLKTAIAAAEQGLTVGIYSGEMSETKVGYRVDTLMSHISNTKIIHGNGQIKDEYKKFLEDVKSSLPGKIIVTTPVMIGGTAGVGALRAFIEKYNLDILCIDQHSLLDDDRGAKNPVERASNISKDLKNLQIMKKIPIISVVQQNREKNEDGTPDTRNVSSSDRIGQDATCLISFEQKEQKDSKDKLLTMYLTKSRDSVNGKTLKYIVNFDTGTLIFVPEETDATNGAKCEQLKNEYEDNPAGYEAKPF